MGLIFVIRLQYSLCDSFKLLQNIMIPKSKNTKTGVLQCFCPDIIFGRTFLVLAAIYFNN